MIPNDPRSESTLSSQNDYAKHGRFNYSTVTRRFGPWVKVMKLTGLEISNYHKIDDAELLEDLRRVAKIINKKTVSQPEYKSNGKYSPDPFKDHLVLGILHWKKLVAKKNRSFKKNLQF